MSVLSPWTLLATAAVSSPAWWAALHTHTLSPATAATRTLIVLIVCSIAVGALESLVDAYASGHGTPQRRTEDRAEDDGYEATVTRGPSDPR